MESNNKPTECIDLCDAPHCDVTFRVEGKLVRFSRSVLEFYSPVFATIFSGRWSEDKDPSDPIELEKTYDDICMLFTVLSPDGFRSIHPGNFHRLLELADYYQIGGVASHCERFLLENLSSYNFLSLCELAAKFNLPGLLKLVNKKEILDKFCEYYVQSFNSMLKLLAVAANATPKLAAVFDCVEKQLVKYSRSEQALDLLIAGFQCGSKLIVDKSLPAAAKKASLAQLQAAKAKLSAGLHCELMLHHFACAESMKKPSAPRNKSIG